MWNHLGKFADFSNSFLFWPTQQLLESLHCFSLLSILVGRGRNITLAHTSQIVAWKNQRKWAFVTDGLTYNGLTDFRNFGLLANVHSLFVYSAWRCKAILHTWWTCTVQICSKIYIHNSAYCTVSFHTHVHCKNLLEDFLRSAYLAKKHSFIPHIWCRLPALFPIFDKSTQIHSK